MAEIDIIKELEEYKTILKAKVKHDLSADPYIALEKITKAINLIKGQRQRRLQKEHITFANKLLLRFKKEQVYDLLHDTHKQFPMIKMYYEDFEKIVREVEKECSGRWTSVEDGLPKKAGSYLVIGKSGGATVTRWYEPSTYYPNGHFGGNSSDYIKYWMPRPEPPEEFENSVDF